MNIFIDTQDMEERYSEDLYKEYLENQNKNLKSTLTDLEEYLAKIVKNGADIEKLTCSNILVYLKELKEKYNLGDKENE